MVKGPDEVVSEAFAMKNYALEQGVDEKDIILEDKSTSTEENIIFQRKFIPVDKKFRSCNKLLSRLPSISPSKDSRF